jgi:tRNA threonylcarbamoyladenosine biosynthesis protein TsaE
MQVTLELNDLEATDRLGKLLAEHLPRAAVIALSGTLGAGKTRLVQAIAAACGVDPADVTSPTFVLCREYHGTRTIYHLDVYRLKDEDEFLELGAEEMFASQSLVVVEWAERVADFLPEERVEITLDVVGEASRRATLRATTAPLSKAVDAIAAKF